MMRSYFCAFILVLSASEIYSTSLPFFFDGGKASGLGGAFVAVADDSEAVFYNPAGLAQIKKNNNISFQTSSQNYRLNCRRWGYVELRDTTGFGGTTGFGFEMAHFESSYYFSSIFKNFGIGLFYRSIMHEYYHPLISLKPLAEETAVIFSISGNFSKVFRIYLPLSYGVNLKWHYSHLYPKKYILDYGEYYIMKQIHSEFITADVGLLYKFSNFFSFGLTYRNINVLETDILDTKYDIFNVIDDVFVTYDPLLIESLPPNIDIGVKVSSKFGFLSFDIHNLIENPVNGEKKWSGDIHYTVKKYKYVFKKTYHLGLELSILTPFIVRCGFFCQPREWEVKSLYGYEDKDPFFEIMKDKIKIRYIRGFSINVGYKYKDRFEFNVTLENETGDTGDPEAPPPYIFDIFYIWNVQGIKARGIISKYIFSCRYTF